MLNQLIETSKFNWKDWFEVSFLWVNGKPKFNFFLKQKKLIPALRQNGFPFSSSQIEFFMHHIDDEDIAQSAYQFRKKMFNMRICVDFFQREKILSQNDFSEICAYFDKCDEERNKIHREAMKRNEVLQNVRKANKLTAKKRGLIIKDYWADPQHRAVYLEAISRPDVKARRIENFKKTVFANHESYVQKMNSPERLEKISKNSSLMWKNRSVEEKKLLLPKPGARNYVVNGIKLNKYEAQIALMLNELNEKWEYEYPIITENKTYYPDFLILKHKIIIEHFGDWWHSNPEIYSLDYEFYKGVFAKDIHENDKKKIDVYEQHGFKTLIVWERNLINDPESVKKMIKEVFDETKNC